MYDKYGLKLEYIQHKKERKSKDWIISSEFKLNKKKADVRSMSRVRISVIGVWRFVFLA